MCAYIRLKDKRKNTTKEEVINYCHGKIAHFKVPKYVVITDAFPLTASGKVQKFKLREQILKDLKITKKK